MGCSNSRPGKPGALCAAPLDPDAPPRKRPLHELLGLGPHHRHQQQPRTALLQPETDHATARQEAPSVLPSPVEAPTQEEQGPQNKGAAQPPSPPHTPSPSPSPAAAASPAREEASPLAPSTQPSTPAPRSDGGEREQASEGDVVLGEVWAGRFVRARGLVGDKDRSDARMALHVAETYFWKVVVSGDSAFIHDALSSVGHVLSLTASQSPSSTLFSSLPPHQLVLKHDLHAIASQALLYRGVLEGANGQFVKAPLTVRAAYKSFASIPADSPSRFALSYRAAGLGMFKLFIILAPPAAQLVLKIVGLTGNKNEGIALLKGCKGPAKPLAHSMLAAFHLVTAAQAHRTQEEVKREVARAVRLASQGPPSFISLWLLCEAARREGDYVRAAERMVQVREAIDDHSSPLYRLRYTTAQLYFVQMRFEEALSEFRGLTTPESTYTAKAFALIYEGACGAMVGHDDAQVRACWQQVVDMPDAHKGRMDKMLTVKARALLQRANTKLAAFELLLLVGQLVLSEEQLGAMEPTLREFLAAAPERSEERVAATLLLGMLQNRQGNFEQADGTLREAISMASGPWYAHLVDTYHLPFARFELGAGLVKRGRLEEAKHEFDKSEKWHSGYSFEGSLGYRVRTAKRHLHDDA